MNFSPETYRDVFDRLEADGVRYVVIGGVAVCLHGHARPIADLDVVVSPAPEECERALRVLIAAGFTPTLPLPLGMVSMLRLFDHAPREIDLFVRSHVPFEELWADSARRRVGRSVVRVASLEHVQRAKRIDARPLDLRDIAALDAPDARPAAPDADADE